MIKNMLIKKRSFSLKEKKGIYLLVPKLAVIKRKYFFKRAVLGLVFGIIAISCSPYTISRLVTNAEDAAILLDNSEYQKAEEELQELSQQEEQITQALAVIEAQSAKKSQTVLSADSRESSESESFAPAFDPAVAPGKVEMKIRTSDREIPDFKIKVEFIAVGGKTFSVEADESGEISLELTSGRYYGKIISANSNYFFSGANPAFFLNANEEKNLGTFYLEKK